MCGRDYVVMDEARFLDFHIRERLSETAREQLERAEKVFDEMCKRGAIFHGPVTKALIPQEFMEG